MSVGKIVGVHGIKGDIKVLLYNDEERRAWKVVYTMYGGRFLDHSVVANRPHKGVMLFRLSDIRSRGEAQELVGGEFYLRREECGPLRKGEYYYFELKGMRVRTEHGRCLGTVEGVFATGGNDVYEIHGPYGEILLPAIKDVILSVNREKEEMVVHLLEGLMEE